MKLVNVLVILLMITWLSACSGNKQRSCDEERRYQLAAEGKQIETPDDLTDLDPLRQMPLPEANPRPPRPEGSPCIDLPPSVLTGEE